MAAMNEGATGPGGGNPRPPFRALLTPHRSLSRRDFVLLIAALGGLSFTVGVAFTLVGAWPVLGFFGLDVLLVYCAFHLSERAAQAFEMVEIVDGRLTLTQVDPKGAAKAFEFEPYWVRVELVGPNETGLQLALTSHGRRLVFAGFLSHEEKQGFATRLVDALRPYQPA
jgi:uncharacterized membrane protein